MKIEVLYPEICNLYGELGNVRFLKQSCPEIEVIETGLNDEPYFVKNRPDLIYMGTMSEKSQLMVISRLEKYKERILQLIEDGGRFLITGNALEVFGQRIEDKDGSVVECLGIFGIVTKRDMMNRFNSLYLGSFDATGTFGNTGTDGTVGNTGTVGCAETAGNTGTDGTVGNTGTDGCAETDGNADGSMKIAGYKSQFTHSWWVDEEAKGLFKTDRGPGLNPEISEEGIRVNNFMATYIIGPLLVLNPPFAKLILRECGIDSPLAFEKEAMEAYEARIAEYSEPNRGIYY